MYDLIIKNGTILDGTGAPGYAADIALKDGKIAKIAKEIQAGGRILDASGLTVTPGFIDSHSHSDRAILPFPEQAEKVEQGITTAIAGQCGSTSAPGKDHPTMGSFLAAVKDIPQGANTALFVGHNALRNTVIGPDNREPSPEELQRMKELLAEGVDSGAMGVSFGLIYPPSGYAKLDELIQLARTAGSSPRTSATRAIRSSKPWQNSSKCCGSPARVAYSPTTRPPERRTGARCVRR